MIFEKLVKKVFKHTLPLKQHLLEKRFPYTQNFLLQSQFAVKQKYYLLESHLEEKLMNEHLQGIGAEDMFFNVYTNDNKIELFDDEEGILFSISADTASKEIKEAVAFFDVMQDKDPHSDKIHEILPLFCKITQQKLAMEVMKRIFGPSVTEHLPNFQYEVQHSTNDLRNGLRRAGFFYS
jgi:hypothetical protein